MNEAILNHKDNIAIIQHHIKHLEIQLNEAYSELNMEHIQLFTLQLKTQYSMLNSHRDMLVKKLLKYL